MSYAQISRGLSIKTSLGDNKFFLYRIRAKEELGRLFEFQLDLLSVDANIDLDKVLGTPAAIEILLPNESRRYLHGHFASISFNGYVGELALYRATLVPWFWFLTRNADCRIFQQKTVPDIAKQVFQDRGYSDFSFKLRGTYDKRDFCVQYRESDFNFVSRLFETHGIYYYFIHEKTKHTLVVADAPSAHGSDSAHVNYLPKNDALAAGDIEHIYDWEACGEIHTALYTVTDFDFENPKADLLAKEKTKNKKFVSSTEIFDYPGGHVKTADGKNVSVRGMELHESRYRRFRGESNILRLAAGTKVEIKGHYRLDQNAKYLLLSTDLYAEASEYDTVTDPTGVTKKLSEWIGSDAEERDSGSPPARKCSFEAIPEATTFRPDRVTPVPQIRGPQTAIVVGAKNDEILTDKYGRVKVQFHWDRYGKSDDKSSCWIRVAQSWAGKRWGTIHIPRVGQEVIVEFLEADPDRPIVTGRVYNAVEMPPYQLPDKQTQSGIKTQSTDKGNAKNFNELRFDDKIGKEHIYFHAERDFERVVENNDSLKVGFETKDKGDQTILVYNDQKIEIEKGMRSSTIYGDENITVKTGNRALTLKQGNDSVKISAGTQTTEAAKSIFLKVGGSSIKIDQQGVVIKGAKVSIQGSLKAEVNATLVDVKASGILGLKGGLVKIN